MPGLGRCIGLALSTFPEPLACASHGALGLCIASKTGPGARSPRLPHASGSGPLPRHGRTSHSARCSPHPLGRLGDPRVTIRLQYCPATLLLMAVHAASWRASMRALAPVAVAVHPAHHLIHGGVALRYLGQAFVWQSDRAGCLVSVEDAAKVRGQPPGNRAASVWVKRCSVQPSQASANLIRQVSGSHAIRPPPGIR